MSITINQPVVFDVLEKKAAALLADRDTALKMARKAEALRLQMDELSQKAQGIAAKASLPDSILGNKVSSLLAFNTPRFSCNNGFNEKEYLAYQGMAMWEQMISYILHPLALSTHVLSFVQDTFSGRSDEEGRMDFTPENVSLVVQDWLDVPYFMHLSAIGTTWEIDAEVSTATLSGIGHKGYSYFLTKEENAEILGRRIQVIHNILALENGGLVPFMSKDGKPIDNNFIQTTVIDAVKKAKTTNVATFKTRFFDVKINKAETTITFHNTKNAKILADVRSGASAAREGDYLIRADAEGHLALRKI